LAGYSVGDWPFDGDTLQTDYVYSTYNYNSGVINYASYEIHGGSSGGPAYAYYGGDERYAVGIHVAGSPGVGNVANLLTAADIDLIKKWINNNGDGVDPVIKGTNTDDNIFGYDTDNILYGRDGSDNIYGEGGNDIINGGMGKDTLHGGSGEDQFRFTEQLKGPNVDKIADFEVNKDVILLDKKIFTKIGSSLSSKEFEIGKKADGKKDRIIYDDKKGILYHDANGDGPGQKKLFATLQKKLALDHQDFDMIG
jgi:Ca2+-binding RTX toxin-like protein